MRFLAITYAVRPQRAYEFEALAKDFGLMVDVLPTDASCEDIEVDEQLSFLDPFVNDALRRGAKRYVPPTQRFGALDAIKPKHGAALAKNKARSQLDHPR